MRKNQPSSHVILDEPAPSPENQPAPKPPKSLGKRATGALFWNVVFLPVKATLGLVVSLVIIRLFLQEAYLALATVTSLLSILGLYTDLGIERALPRFVAEVEQTKGRSGLRRFIFRVTVIKLALLTAVIVFFAVATDLVIGWFSLGSEGRIYLALICTLLVLGALYDIATQVLFSFFKQKATNLLDIVVTVLNPVMTLILIVGFKMEVYGVMLALLITTVISVIIATWQAWLASKEAAEKPQPLKLPKVTFKNGFSSGKKGSLWLRFVKYAGLMYFFNISTSFYDASFAILLLAAYKELTAVLIVKVVYNFIKTLLKTLLAPFVGVQTPLFSSIYAEGRTEALHTAYASISKLQIIILVPSGVGVIILARNLLELLFVETHTGAVLPPDLLSVAAWATGLTVFFTFTEALISLPMTVLMVFERYRAVIFSRILPLLTAPLLILGIWFGWGAIGAVTLMGLVAVLSRVVAMVLMQRTMGLMYPVKFLWKVVKATAAFGIPLGVLVWLLPVNWIATIGIAAAGVIIFYAVFKWLGGFDMEDKNRIMSMKLPLRRYIVKYL